mgnify:CR=1 FL=1
MVSSTIFFQRMWFNIVVMLMKENIKIFLIALILGMAVAFFLSYKFKEPIAYALNPEVTILYVGSYNNIDTATSKQRNYPNSIIYEEEGIYKIVIGIFGDTTVLDLMKSYFHDQGLNFYEEKIKTNSAFLREINNYELLIKSSETSYYDTLNKSLLNLFNEYINEFN